MGKSTISMAIFQFAMFVYQRVDGLSHFFLGLHPSKLLQDLLTIQSSTTFWARCAQLVPRDGGPTDPQGGPLGLAAMAEVWAMDNDLSLPIIGYLYFITARDDCDFETHLSRSAGYEVSMWTQIRAPLCDGATASASCKVAGPFLWDWGPQSAISIFCCFCASPVIPNMPSDMPWHHRKKDTRTISTLDGTWDTPSFGEAALQKVGPRDTLKGLFKDVQSYPLVICYIAVVLITICNGTIHYFYDNFQ